MCWFSGLFLFEKVLYRVSIASKVLKTWISGALVLNYETVNTICFFLCNHHIWSDLETFCDALCSMRTSCVYYQVMDGHVCIQDTRSVADRRIHTQGRTTTCFKHRKNWRNCPISIFIELITSDCHVFLLSKVAIFKKLKVFPSCYGVICVLPPKSWKTSEWDERDDSGPLCGGWHSKVGETRHSLVSTIPPFSRLTNILPLFWHEIQDKALEKRKIFDDVIKILTTFQIE